VAAPTFVEQRRKQMRLFSWAGAAVFGGTLIALNIIFSYLPIRIDSSDGQAYSLSNGTKTVLKRLDDTLLVKIIYSSQLPPLYKQNQQYLSDLLVEYRRASHGRVRIEYFDPSVSPEAKQQAIMAGVVPVQMDVRERDRREVKECFMGLSLMYAGHKEAIPLIEDTQGLEYEITSRIKRLIDPTMPAVGFVSAGEGLTLESAGLQNVKDPIGRLYDVKSVDLKGPIPDSVKALWLVGPSKELPADAVQKLDDWVKKGGTLGLLLDRRDVRVETFTTTPLKTGLEPLLQEWGIAFPDGEIFDPQCDRIQIRSTQGSFQMINIVDYPYFPWVTELNRQNPATKGVDGFSMPFASSLEIDKEKPGLTYTALARTSPASWLDLEPGVVSPLQRKERSPKGEKGPFNVAMTVEGKFDPAQAKPGKVILFSSSRFIRAEFPPRPQNYTMFLNMLDWSAQDEVLLSIRSKNVGHHPLKNVDDSVRLLVKYAMIFLLPLATLAAGFWVWRVASHRRAFLPLRYQDA